MKVVIQIPCYNEAESLPITLAALPAELTGVDELEILVVDDGSTDGTGAVAAAHGVTHVITHGRNMGLAAAFLSGLRAALISGADIVVNLDADNQYCADCIPDLIKPIMDGQAEMVIGARSIDTIQDFSTVKKVLQRLGSWAVRQASGTDVPDAPSGFRAISREAALKIRVYNDYTYTLETIIQAGQKGIPIKSVPVKTNKSLRPSRLVSSIPRYILKSVITIVRIFIVYRPFRFFFSAGAGLAGVGTLIGLRFLWFYLTDQGGGHVQSLILASILVGIGFQTVVVAFLADLLSVNRRFLEEIDYRMRKQELESSKSESSGQAG
jgi:glycosyltransferase involved in cell wall biosynthesis